MKVALIISGYLRSFKNNIESLNKNLLNLYDVDIYIHITNSNESKYINNIISIDEIKSLFLTLQYNKAEKILGEEKIMLFKLIL